MMSRPLELRNIRTKRGGFTLSIDRLELRAGAIACVVGPNGGGKTTLLLTMLGLLPHDGECLVSGSAFDGTQVTAKVQMGFVPDDPELLFEELTALEHWDLAAGLQAGVTGELRSGLMQRALEIAEKLSFVPPSTIAKQYSHGMRKKTQIVQALLGRPPVLIIDELRNGLDPIAIRQSETLIKNEKARGAAILAATHDLWWAERFADHVFVLNKGELVAQGPPKRLLRRGEQNLEEAFMRIVGASI